MPSLPERRTEKFNFSHREFPRDGASLFEALFEAFSAVLQLRLLCKEKLFLLLAGCCFVVFTLHLVDEQVKKGEGTEDRERIGKGNGVPHAIESEVVRQDQDTGHEEEQLAREAHEDALAGMADALEEVADNHLRTYEGKHHDVDAETARRHSQNLLRLSAVAVREEAGDQLGTEFANEEADGGYARCGKDGKAEGLPDAVILVGSPVVAHDGLHALVHAHHDHEEEEDDAIDDTVGSEGVVASVLAHALVDEEYHEAGAGIEQEGREADDQNLTHDLRGETVDAALQMNKFCGT